MLEQDYVMRMIKEMVRAVLKLVFNVDTASPTAELLENSNERDTLNELMKLVDVGEICDAENQLYEITKDGQIDKLKIGLLFYLHLNTKTDEFLEKHRFSREEVQQGFAELVSGYGLNNVYELFMLEVDDGE